MTKSEPLLGQTVIFTGTPKSQEVLELVTQYGGIPVSLPLIEVEELVESTDKLRLDACATYDWLIFTSQSAVASFEAKLNREQLSASSIPCKIAAIGTKTAAALEKIGFAVQFIPTVFSADVFVEEFKPMENDIRRLLFLRGSIAGPTITEELPFEVDEWTIYKTEKAVGNANKLTALLQEDKTISILFASPSAVQVFSKEVARYIGWNGYTIGAIGHVTEKALRDAGAPVHVKPSIYTLKDLVDKLASRKGVQVG